MTTTVIPFLAGEAGFPPPVGLERDPQVRDSGSPGTWGWWEATDLPNSEEYSALWPYRERTVGLLRRYMRLSVEVGRLPSLLGREFFRTQVTSYHVSTFEDVVIFVHDMERSLEKLDGFAQELIARIVMQEYSQDEAARLLHCGLRTVERCFPDALDELSRILLLGGILETMVEPEEILPENCQGGETEENSASCWNDGE